MDSLLTRKTTALLITLSFLIFSAFEAGAQNNNIVLPLDDSDPLISSITNTEQSPVFENGDTNALQSNQFFAIITPEDSINFEASDPASSAYISNSVNNTIFLRNSFNTQYEEEGLYMHCVWEINPNVSLQNTPSDYCDSINENAENMYPITYPFSVGGRPCIVECDPSDSSGCSCPALKSVVEKRLRVIQSGTTQ